MSKPTVRCPRGHEKTDANVYLVRVVGRRGEYEIRRCRTCRSERDAKRGCAGPRGRSHSPSPNCTYGHPWTPATTTYSPAGHRKCLVCKRGQKRTHDAHPDMTVDKSGTFCPRCFLRTDTRTGRQERLGLPASPHVCPPVSAGELALDRRDAE